MHILAITLPALIAALYIRQNALFLWYTGANALSWENFALGTASIVTTIVAYETCIIRPDHGVYALLDIVCGITTFIYGTERMTVARSIKFLRLS